MSPEIVSLHQCVLFWKAYTLDLNLVVENIRTWWRQMRWYSWIWSAWAMGGRIHGCKPHLLFSWKDRHVMRAQDRDTNTQSFVPVSLLTPDVQGWVSGRVWQPFTKSSLTPPPCFGILLQLLRGSHGKASCIRGKLLGTTTELLLTGRLCVRKCHTVTRFNHFHSFRNKMKRT